MIQIFIRILCRFFGLLPLPVMHALALFLGTIAYFFAPKSRRRIAQNLAIARLPNSRLEVWKTSCEIIKGGLELTIAWTRSEQHIVSLFKNVHGWAEVEPLLGQKGLLFITPHLGSYDLAGRMLSEMLPCDLTAMYRPPHKSYLEPIMKQGRERGKGHAAAATAQGVRQVLRALKKHEAVIILPDQVPQAGEGIMAQFFNHDAYCMTLAARLAQMDNIAVLFFTGVRLPYGRGFDLEIISKEIHFKELSLKEAVQKINDVTEEMIRQHPHQYLFSYNRYKMPANHS